MAQIEPATLLGSCPPRKHASPESIIEARVAHMEEAAVTGAYAPLLELPAAPFRATVVKQLP